MWFGWDVYDDVSADGSFAGVWCTMDNDVDADDNDDWHDDDADSVMMGLVAKCRYDPDIMYR